MKPMSEKEIRAHLIKSYIWWIIPWIIIMALYITIGLTLNIYETYDLLYLFLAFVIGAFIERTSVKTRTALKLLDDFAMAISEEDLEEDED